MLQKQYVQKLIWENAEFVDNMLIIFKSENVIAMCFSGLVKLINSRYLNSASALVDLEFLGKKFQIDASLVI